MTANDAIWVITVPMFACTIFMMVGMGEILDVLRTFQDVPGDDPDEDDDE